MKLNNGSSVLACGLVEFWSDGLFVEAQHPGESTVVSLQGTTVVRSMLYSVAISSQEVRWRDDETDLSR